MECSLWCESLAKWIYIYIHIHINTQLVHWFYSTNKILAEIRKGFFKTWASKPRHRGVSKCYHPPRRCQTSAWKKSDCPTFEWSCGRNFLGKEVIHILKTNHPKDIVLYFFTWCFFSFFLGGVELGMHKYSQSHFMESLNPWLNVSEIWVMNTT